MSTQANAGVAVERTEPFWLDRSSGSSCKRLGSGCFDGRPAPKLEEACPASSDSPRCLAPTLLVYARISGCRPNFGHTEVQARDCASYQDMSGGKGVKAKFTPKLDCLDRNLPSPRRKTPVKASGTPVVCLWPNTLKAEGRAQHDDPVRIAGSAIRAIQRDGVSKLRRRENAHRWPGIHVVEDILRIQPKRSRL